MVIFSTRKVDEYEDRGYFGDSSEITQEGVTAKRRAWVNAMAFRGWILDDSIIFNSDEFRGEVVDLWNEYERAGDIALREAEISTRIDVPTKAHFEAVDRYEDLRRETRGKANQEELLEKLVNSGSLSTEPVTSDMSWVDGAVMLILIALVMLGGYLLR